MAAGFTVPLVAERTHQLPRRLQGREKVERHAPAKLGLVAGLPKLGLKASRP
jgi:hypothetical protein